MKRNLAAALAVLTLSLILAGMTAPPARAGYTSWVEYAGNPVYDPAGTTSRAYYPCVIYDADKFSGYGGSYYYKMWYADTSAAQWESVAYSDDGINWTNQGAVSGIVNVGYHAKILYFPGGYSGTGGTYYYRIWYWDSTPAVLYSINAIRTADSADGINWANDRPLTQDATYQLVTGVGTDWNYGSYGPIEVFYNPSAGNTGTDPFNYTYTMYYDAATGANEVTALAYSTDGDAWTRYHEAPYANAPVVDHGGAGDWDSGYSAQGTVIRESAGVWHYWYSGGQTSLWDGIGYASSTDGINWTKSGDNPILDKDDGVAWRNVRTYTPMVVYSPTRFDGHGTAELYRMWFTGRDSTGNYAIGTATRTSVTIAAAAGAGGSITPSGAVSVAVGDDQTFTITPDANHHISDVLVDGVSVGAVPSYTFNDVDSAHTISAVFALDTNVIVSAAGTGGTIDPSGAVVVDYGADQTFTITPDEGYRVSDVLVDGVSVGAVPSYTFSSVTSPHTITAIFAEDARVLYFAEGYTGEGFQEYLCLGNAGIGPVTVDVTYLFTDGTALERSCEVPPLSRLTVDVNSEVGPGRDVSIKCEAVDPFVAERPMYFDYTGGGGNWTGGTDAVGAAGTSDTWYFAEGYTGPGFDEWICVLNPGDLEASLTFNFQTQEEGLVVPDGTYIVPARSRATFKANDLLGGRSYQTSLKLVSDRPVVAERPMYFDYQGTNSWGWTGGHCVMGTSSLAGSYYFAEGTTRHGFEEWLTLQNPGEAEMTVSAVYYLAEGSPVVRDYRVPAGTRGTVFVADEVGSDQDVSVFLSSESAFLAERPMYFDYQGTNSWGWTGGHCVIGADAPGTEWFFAEGYTGEGFEEWLCIQNPGDEEATLEITYLPEGGALPVIRFHPVPAASRYTVYVNSDAGEGMPISALLASDQLVIVERPMYFNYTGAGGSWTGGTDVLGYRP